MSMTQLKLSESTHVSTGKAIPQLNQKIGKGNKSSFQARASTFIPRETRGSF